MKLSSHAFEQISDGSKIYEVRLYDEKRRNIKVGDKIIFFDLPLLENRIEVKVLNLIVASNFKELFTMFNPVLAGWKDSNSPEECANDMSKYYSRDEQNRYGVVAIEIKLDKQDL